MTTETSAVLVAVRVRPFSSKEDPMECTVTVPDATTITVTNIASIVSSFAAPSGGSGGMKSERGQSVSSVSSVASAAPVRSDTGSQRHAFHFDKVFWSVPPDVLPLGRTHLTDTGGPIPLSETPCHQHVSSSWTCFSSDTPTEEYADVSLGGTISSAGGLGLGGSIPHILNNLPCGAKAPGYDDQSDVYAFFGPRMCQSVMSGFNSCLFAYGQTGSGKTYSMVGPPDKLSMESEDVGIMPRLCRDLFRLMKEERQEESVTYTVEASFLEIYCEKVRDLLLHGSAGASHASHTLAHSGTGGSSLRIRQHPTRGPYVEGLAKIKATSAEGVMRCLLSGLRDRATAETKMNLTSSRSHAILHLYITKVTVVPEEQGVSTKTRTCKLNMVDLAGSERATQSGATGDRLEEAKNINLSLSTLGRVIQQLSERHMGKNTIPAYRESMLTWLLSDSLGGNSKTLMLATVAPSAYCYQQTLNTLRFAGIAKKVVNVATVNEDLHFQQLIADLRQQIVHLTMQLEHGKASEVHTAAINAMQEDGDAMRMQIDLLNARMACMVDPAVVHGLRRRIAHLEEEQLTLHNERQQLERKLLLTTSTLRDDLSKAHEELIRLQGDLAKKETEAQGLLMHLREASHGNYKCRSVADGMKQGSSGASPSARNYGIPTIIQMAYGARAGRKQAGSLSRSPLSTSLPLASSMDSSREESHVPITLPSAVASVVAGPSFAQRQQAEISRLQKRLADASQVVGSLQQANTSLSHTSNLLQRDLDEYKVRYNEAKRQREMLHAQLESTTSLLETTQSHLSAMQVEAGGRTVHAMKDSTSDTVQREAELLAEVEQTREKYLKEKQENVNMLLCVAESDQLCANYRERLARTQFKLEETEMALVQEWETAKREYLRLRHYRIVCEYQRLLTRHLMNASCESRNPSRWSFTGGGGDVRAHDVSSYTVASCPPSVRSHGQSVSISVASSQQGPSPFLGLTAAAAQMNATDLLYAQLQHECLCDEALHRVEIERDNLKAAQHLMLSRIQLRRLEATALMEKVSSMQGELTVKQEEAALHHTRYQEMDAEQAAMTQELKEMRLALQESERLREVLSRQNDDIRRRCNELELMNASLVERLAEVQLRADVLQIRCTEIEQAATRSEELLLSGLDSRPIALESAVAMKENELQTAINERDALRTQCKELRNALGVLHAMREKEAADRSDLQQQAQRTSAQLQREVSSLRAAQEQLIAEQAAAERDYELQLDQQKETLRTLRAALTEEAAVADACRSTAQKLQSERLAREADFDVLTRERKLGVEAQRDLQAKSDVMQAELNELREAYSTLEKQLMDMQVRAPEMYLLLERRAEEDGSAWLIKARQEKANVERQTREAHRLNEELLQHVRRRNAQLCVVQRHLDEREQGKFFNASVDQTWASSYATRASITEESCCSIPCSARLSAVGVSPADHSQDNVATVLLDNVSLPSTVDSSMASLTSIATFPQ